MFERNRLLCFVIVLVSLATALPVHVAHAQVAAPAAPPVGAEVQQPSSPIDEADWTVAEKLIWLCASHGQTADLGNHKCTKSSAVKTTFAQQFADCDSPEPANAADRVVRPSFIQTLVTVEKYNQQLGAIGISIVGALFRNQLDLEGAHVRSKLGLYDSAFKVGIDFDDATFDSAVSLDHSAVCQTFRLRRAHVHGALSMAQGIYGSIEATDTTIDQGLNIDGSVVFLYLLMDRSRIGKQFALENSSLTHLLARNAVFDGDIAFDATEVRCQLGLSGSHVAGSISWIKGELGYISELGGHRFYSWRRYAEQVAAGSALAQAILVRASRNEPACVRDALFDHMTVDGSFCVQNILPVPNATDFGSKRAFLFSIDSTTVLNTLSISWAVATGSGNSAKPIVADQTDNVWRFTNLKVDRLYSDLKNWPKSYDLTGTTYRAFFPANRRCELLGASGNEVRIDLNQSPNANEIPDRVLAWVSGSQRWNIQPFAAAIEAMKNGKYSTKNLEIALEDDKTAHLGGLEKLLQWSYGAMVGYGHEPFNIIWWSLGVIVVFGTALRIFEPKPIVVGEGSEAVSIRPGYFFALDTFVPVLRMREANYKLELRHPVMRGCLYVHRALGFVFSSFLLAGLSGLTIG
jgi:hypothetical protein